jgi:hypothetical protein
MSGLISVFVSYMKANGNNPNILFAYVQFKHLQLTLKQEIKIQFLFAKCIVGSFSCLLILGFLNKRSLRLYKIFF